MKMVTIEKKNYAFTENYLPEDLAAFHIAFKATNYLHLKRNKYKLHS